MEAPGWRLPSTRSAAMVRRHWEVPSSEHRRRSVSDRLGLCRGRRRWPDDDRPEFNGHSLSQRAPLGPQFRSASATPTGSGHGDVGVSDRGLHGSNRVCKLRGVALAGERPKLRQPGRGNLQPHLSLTVRRGRHHEPSLLDDTLGRIARQSRASILPRDDSWRLPKLAVANRTRDREAGGRQSAVPMGVMNAQTVSNCTTGQVSVRVMPWTA